MGRSSPQNPLLPAKLITLDSMHKAPGVHRAAVSLFSRVSSRSPRRTPSEELGLPRTEKTFTQATEATVPPVTQVTRGGVIHSLLDRAATLHLLPLKCTWHDFPTHAKSGTRPRPFTLRPKSRRRMPDPTTAEERCCKGSRPERLGLYFRTRNKTRLYLSSFHSN